ncbi:MAG: PrsW family intramembrane metalloprotease, partial [Nanoarchaeota archaeon]|nr:PrsW family intramembrane metalloprotease [Nanoarchaeota archaeon]
MALPDVMLGFAISLLMGFIPMAFYSLMITLIDRYEREPFLLMLGVFLWGFIVASGIALVLNTLFGNLILLVTGSREIALLGSAVLSAPLVEETAKGLAVLSVFLFFRNEFDSVIDGIIYGSLVGFGFAAAENILYGMKGFASMGFTGLIAISFLRNLLIPFLHGFLTSLTGI